ncbi:uncharacterized protein P884DRAFT_320520, partial [Thermothelomyces heterothallicus CBS 202.75]|uniref:uncharacterized protein n=1 Tax=Thermothelomyces heterothallicus CBS 202.75 TaxID=1149848 RepID=UPI00374393AF
MIGTVCVDPLQRFVSVQSHPPTAGSRALTAPFLGRQSGRSAEPETTTHHARPVHRAPHHLTPTRQLGKCFVTKTAQPGASSRRRVERVDPARSGPTAIQRVD